MLIIKNLIIGALLIVLAEAKCTRKTTCKTDIKITNNSSDRFEYYVMNDAGESGNRFYVYDMKNFESYTFNEEKPRQVELLKCTADGGGLHTVRDKEELRNNFKSCFKKIESIIPPEKKGNTIINSAASSGMRLLGIKNNQRANEILQMTYEVLKETGYFTNRALVEIKEGETEGAYAQFQANFISNNIPSKSGAKYFGVMDMGSGSVQLTYKPNTNENSADLYNLVSMCPAVDYIYANSQDCFGQNEFRHMYYASIIAKHVLANKSTLDINSACLPKNSRVKLSDSFYKSICTIWQFAPSAIKIEKDILGKYTLVGNSDSVQCQKEIRELMDTRECKNETCSFQGLFQPPVDNISFKAINGFYYAIDNAKRLLNVDNFTMQEFIDETNKICAKSLQELATLNNDNNNGKLDDEFIIRQCFLANYVIETLKNNGFSSFDKIDFVQKENGMNFGWSLTNAYFGAKVYKNKPISEIIKGIELSEDYSQLIYKAGKQNSKALRTIAFLVNL